MPPSSSAISAKPKPSLTDPSDNPKHGAGIPSAPRPLLEPDGSYNALINVEPLIAKRLLTRTGRGTREEQERELPFYIERLVKRALETECF